MARLGKTQENANMGITDTQDYAIALSVGTFNYHRERSRVVSAKGENVTDKAGREVFVGTFVVHLYHRGVFRLGCALEDILGKQFYSVDKEKLTN